SKIVSLLSRHRLVTLVGAGGTGKTRLATHVASVTADGDDQTCWCAELASVTGTEEIAEVILASLGIRSSTGLDLSAQVARYLSGRAGLLLLDTCEHVRDPVAALCHRTPRRAPDVCFLATSREPLGIEGEVLLPVPPLAVPGDDALETVAAAH